MGLLDDIEAACKPRTICKFAQWFEEQDEDYQTEISEALDGGFPTRTIWRVLTAKHGQFVSATVFERHRNGVCSCGTV